MGRTVADDRLLEAALEVIAREGYAGATTRQIAAEAGVNEVTLFRRFGSKKGLMMAAVEWEAQTNHAADIDYTGQLEADLERIVEFYGGLMRRRGHVVLMLAAEGARLPELSEILRGPTTLIGRAVSILARYQTSGVLVDEPPAQALAALVGPLLLSKVLSIVGLEPASESFDATLNVRRFLAGHAQP